MEWEFKFVGKSEKKKNLHKINNRSLVKLGEKIWKIGLAGGKSKLET